MINNNDNSNNDNNGNNDYHNNNVNIIIIIIIIIVIIIIIIIIIIIKTNKPQDIPWWFTGGKTLLIPKPGQFSSENQRSITCLNTIYKWFKTNESSP